MEGSQQRPDLDFQTLAKIKMELRELPATTAEFNVNLDEVDLKNLMIQAVQSSLFSSEAVQLPLPFGSEVEVDSEPEEEEEELPEDEHHRHFVYSWRWRGDERFAKIGRTRNGLKKGVKKRMVKTYNPTDDPVLLGVRECDSIEASKATEKYLLDGLKRTRPDREWVEIDEVFNELIDKSFSDVKIE
ncbi:GIY-YIG nuclease family protein [Candidatus Poribacteria bacterium]|nr:GIY-YIG nuclease family protein [Candidatus Poribacteria bacterium]MYB01799.1 GIY-YIG nuclease family protein [Candidatus Poribacteria bacterium]MYI36909.1 GIY-YIG nuclease family protein [Acidimicrobiaceae bacterium]